MLSVANSCDYNANLKKYGKNVYRQIPAPRDLPQEIPAPWDAKAPEWGQIFGGNPGGCMGGEDGYGKN